MIDRACAKNTSRVLVSEDQIPEQPLRQPDLIECLLETLAREDGLRCCFQDDGVAGNQRGHDRVDGRQVRIIPGRNDEHQPERIALDIALETGFRLGNDRGQRLLGDVGHVRHAFSERIEFAAISHGAAHLQRQLARDLRVHGAHGIEEPQHPCRPLFYRNAHPLLLGSTRG